MITPSIRSTNPRVLLPSPRVSKVPHGTRDIDPRPIIPFIVKMYNMSVFLYVVGDRLGLRETGRWVRTVQINRPFWHTLLPPKSSILVILASQDCNSKIWYGPRDIDPGPIPTNSSSYGHTMLPLFLDSCNPKIIETFTLTSIQISSYPIPDNIGTRRRPSNRTKNGKSYY